MKKLIDLDDESIKLLAHKAIDEGKDLKNYIQDVLYYHARGGFKSKKPTTKRKSK